MNWQSTPQPSNGQHRLTLLEILGAPQAILADLGSVTDFMRERRQKADCSVIRVQWEDDLMCSIRITECGALGLSLIHPPTSQPNLLALTETCAGLGALGLGAQYAGWQVVAQNDINEKFTEHQTRYGKIPVVTGDIADMKTVSALHHAHSTSGMIAFGFSCQPYSTAGDQKHGLDPRSDSLPAGLYASHLLQKEIIICECVTGMNSPIVQIRWYLRSVVPPKHDYWFINPRNHRYIT